MLSINDFKADSYAGSFSAKFRLDDHEVIFRLKGSDLSVFPFFNFASILQVLEKAPLQISDELLADKNGDWRKPGEAEISKEQFIRKLRLLELDLFPDQQLELFYDDGGLFRGHTVIARFDGGGKMLYATLAG